jgi:hypothetical protein
VDGAAAAEARLAAREIAEALVAGRAPQTTRKQDIDLQAALSCLPLGSVTAGWWLARALLRDGRVTEGDCFAAFG